MWRWLAKKKKKEKRKKGRKKSQIGGKKFDNKFNLSTASTSNIPVKTQINNTETIAPRISSL